MATRDFGPLGETAKMLGFGEGAIQNLFNAGSLEVVVQSAIAQRDIGFKQEALRVQQETNIMQLAEQARIINDQINENFRLKQESLITLQETAETAPIMKQTSFCPILGPMDEGV